MSRDIDKALSDIMLIRERMAAGSAFQGYGPAAMAITAGLALAAWGLQAAGALGNAGDPVAYVIAWTGVAVASLAVIGIEARARSARHHSGLADEMVLAAAERLLPSGAAGALLALVILRLAPDALWILPGLWQVLVALGLFASAKTLPGRVSLVAAFYLVAGMGVVAAAAGTRTAEPWMMGAPFAAGQALMALVLHRARLGGVDAR